MSKTKVGGYRRWFNGLLSGFAFCASIAVAAPARASSLPHVILKFDDFDLDKPIHPGWHKVFAYLNAHDVVGPSASSLRRTQPPMKMPRSG